MNSTALIKIMAHAKPNVFEKSIPLEAFRKCPVEVFKQDIVEKNNLIATINKLSSKYIIHTIDLFLNAKNPAEYKNENAAYKNYLVRFFLTWPGLLAFLFLDFLTAFLTPSINSKSILRSSKSTRATRTDTLSPK